MQVLVKPHVSLWSPLCPSRPSTKPPGADTWAPGAPGTTIEAGSSRQVACVWV